MLHWVACDAILVMNCDKHSHMIVCEPEVYSAAISCGCHWQYDWQWFPWQRILWWSWTNHESCIVPVDPKYPLHMMQTIGVKIVKETIGWGQTLGRLLIMCSCSVAKHSESPWQSNESMAMNFDPCGLVRSQCHIVQYVKVWGANLSSYILLYGYIHGVTCGCAPYVDSVQLLWE